MNSLYLQQTRSLFSSFITILTLVLTLFIIARSAAFLSFTLEGGLNALTFLKFIFYQIPVQATTLLPLCFFASCIATFNTISSSGEHVILRAAGVSQISFFSPSFLTGLILCLLYAPFLLGISPWATLALQEIDSQSREKVAQNTLINAKEPTFIGDAEVFVQETVGANLNGISLFSQNTRGQEVFIYGKTANFTLGSNGIALAMLDGQVLQSQNQQPRTVQSFQNLLIDLAPLIQSDAPARTDTSHLTLNIFDLFSTENKSEYDITEHQKEGGRRLAYLCLIFSMPSWILFWQLLDLQGRRNQSRLPLLGPIFIVPLLIFLQAPGIYAGKSLSVLALTLILILSLGLIGPLYYTVIGARLSKQGLYK